MDVTGTGVCPVSALLRYLAVCILEDGHLFVWEDGRPLTSSAFVTLKQGLQSAGLDMKNFSGHSLHIGAATSAAAAGTLSRFWEVGSRRPTSFTFVPQESPCWEWPASLEATIVKQYPHVTPNIVTLSLSHELYALHFP